MDDYYQPLGGEDNGNDDDEGDDELVKKWKFKRPKDE